MIRVSVYWHVV